MLAKYNYPLLLNFNENHFEAAPDCQKFFLQLSQQYVARYSDVNPSLQQSLAHFFDLPQGDIVLGQGAEDLLKQVFYSIIQSGDTVLLPSNGWLYYKKLAEEVQARIIFYDMIEKEDHFVYDIEKIIDLLKKHSVKLFLIASPNNPTGGKISKQEMEAFIAAIDKKSTKVILDEAYWGFVDSEYCAKDLYQKENVFVLRTFSKLFGLAGMRIGYAFGNEQWKPLMQQMTRYLGMNHFAEQLAIIVLNSWSYYQGLANLFRQEAEKYFRCLKSLQIKVFKTASNFIFARLEEKEFDLLKTQLPLRNIFIKFYDDFKEPLFKNCVRISIGTVEENDFVMQSITDILRKNF